jgi:poly(hydroxyalkanoate) depolymerase family esterase
MRRTGLIVALSAAAELAGGGGALPPASRTPAGQVTYGTWGDGTPERRWRLYVPTRRTGASAAPLLVFLHGCTQDADDAARGTRLDALAERHGVVVLYPEQPAGANALRCWNWFDPAHQQRGSGEPAMLAALVDRVAREQRVDRTRVHVAGVSAGGAMALLLASGHPERFASATSASGVPVGAVSGAAQAWQVMRSGASVEQAAPAAVRTRMAARARVVPLLVLHGGADTTVVPINGRRTAEQWAAAIGATEHADRPGPATLGVRAIRHETWRVPGVPVDAVEYMEISGLGHAWSGGSTAGSYTDEAGPSASELLLRFVSRHALPSGTAK